VETIKEATQENSTLVIGEINVSSSYSNYILKSGIKITLHSIEKDKKIDVVTRDNGLFITTKLEEGIYEIITYSFDTEYNGFTVKTIKPERLKYFSVIKNKVNNLGLIVYRDNIIDYTQNYNFVFDKFKKEYPNLNWNHIEWVQRGYPLTQSNGNLFESWAQNYIVTGDDLARYQELWIFWNLLVEHYIESYPKPMPNESVEDWIKRNLYLVPETNIVTLLYGVSLILEDDGKESPITVEALVRNDVRSGKGFLLFGFHYKTFDGYDLGNAFVAK
jgi:hypothetical protein